jgi:predicted nucleotidyltransferase
MAPRRVARAVSLADNPRMPIPDRYPADLQAGLAALLAGLARLAPAPAVVAYGSLVKGDFRPGESDVNLAVVLASAEPAVLVALRAPLRAAFRAIRARPFLITHAEIPRLAVSYPIKLADIRDHHDVLAGDDPFAAVEIDPTHLRLRVKQELRNHLLRLRSEYVLAGDDEHQLARTLYASASSIGVELGAMLRVLGKRLARGDLAEVCAAAAEHVDPDGGVLDALRAFRDGTGPTRLDELYLGLMGVLERGLGLVDRVEAAP